MKSNKIMNQNLLIETVIQELNSYFNPNISIIKVRINLLVFIEYYYSSLGLYKYFDQQRISRETIKSSRCSSLLDLNDNLFF